VQWRRSLKGEVRHFIEVLVNLLINSIFELVRKPSFEQLRFSMAASR